MKALIRFKGGCGGNFLKTQLHYHSNPNQELHVSGVNSYFYNNSPFEIFQKFTVPKGFCELYSIPPETQWYQVQQEKIEEIMNDLLYKRNEDILLMHLVFKKNFNPDPLFALYELIDLYPSQNGFWITQALQFYKSAFIKEKRLPKQYRLNDDKRHKQIVKHHTDHGWYPSFWGWTIEASVDQELDDVEAFIVKHGNCKRWKDKLGELYMTGREFVIPGEQWVIDTDGYYYELMAETFKLTPKKEVFNNIKAYAGTNIQVLKDLNLYDKTELLMHPDEQLELLKKTFIPIYKQLIEK